MLNILINAYAVSPNWGSEPGMGWNWIINIAKYCNVYVITEGEWKDEIIEAVKCLPQRDNLHFYFNPVDPKIRRICWNQGDWRFYWYYRRWQKKTLEIAREIIANNKIDVIHQLNMIGFREPGYLWKIKDIPLVWGPVGGMNSISSVYRDGLSMRQQVFIIIKNIISDLQLRIHPRVRKMINHSYMIGAVKSVADKMTKYYNKTIPLINETGTYIENQTEQFINNYSSGKLNVLWVGRLIPTKRLDIALKSIAYTNNTDIRLTVCGVGSEETEEKYKSLIRQLGIEGQVDWKGKVEHSKILDIMRESNLFFMTSIADATSTVIVEAISVGLPILSFNACGFGALVKSFAGETIELSNPEQSAKEFANKLNYFFNNRHILKNISENQINNRHILSWEYKAETMHKIYSQLAAKE